MLCSTSRYRAKKVKVKKWMARDRRRKLCDIESICKCLVLERGNVSIAISLKMSFIRAPAFFLWNSATHARQNKTPRQCTMMTTAVQSPLTISNGDRGEISINYTTTRQRYSFIIVLHSLQRKCIYSRHMMCVTCDLNSNITTWGWLREGWFSLWLND